jgi:hypothetical protein
MSFFFEAATKHKVHHATIANFTQSRPYRMTYYARWRFRFIFYFVLFYSNLNCRYCKYWSQILGENAPRHPSRMLWTNFKIPPLVWMVEHTNLNQFWIKPKELKRTKIWKLVDVVILCVLVSRNIPNMQYGYSIKKSSQKMLPHMT